MLTMKCFILATPGEHLEGAAAFHRLGYQTDLVPSTQDLTSLTDEREEEWIPYLNCHPATTERRHVRSLRASFIRMLRSTSVENDDMLIFGESDACPVVPASRIREALQSDMAAHPKTDVFRLFHHAEWSCPRDVPENIPVSFEQFITGNTDANTPYVWGTHALVIPAKSREKVARIFAAYRLPIDIALEAANSNGELNIRTASHNLFYQKPRQSSPSTDRKIALCLTSYKRLPDLQRQLWAMMDQSYARLHVFAAVKGIPESTFHRVLYPKFAHFIEEGRLTMRLFPNKNQLSNLLDTVRDLDTSSYDLFAKIDDDDIYDRDYIRLVNEYHRYLPPHFSSYSSGNGHCLRDCGGAPFLAPYNFICFGPTIVFSPLVLDKLRACELHPTRIPDIAPGAGKGRFGFTEDRLMDIIMQATGSCNRYRYQKAGTVPASVVIRQGNPSVMRGGLVPHDFRSRNDDLKAERGVSERIVEIRHPRWHDLLRIMGDRAQRCTGGDEADVLEHNPASITLRWDKWGTESFRLGKNGTFTLYHPNPSSPLP